MGYQGLQGVTRDYKGLQGIRGGLQWVTRGYKRFYGVTRV